ncbi:hypothetical protein V490_06776 [Pseudogymnoascus sp. VKM F-3557]|nr:hypothetical protein V490_06776 [Pseudogymnoascus sp. VKM F-3557]
MEGVSFAASIPNSYHIHLYSSLIGPSTPAVHKVHHTLPPPSTPPKYRPDSTAKPPVGTTTTLQTPTPDNAELAKPNPPLTSLQSAKQQAPAPERSERKPDPHTSVHRDRQTDRQTERETASASASATKIYDPLIDVGRIVSEYKCLQSGCLLPVFGDNEGGFERREFGLIAGYLAHSLG